MTDAPFRLRSLPPAVRLGLAFTVLVFMLGFATGGAYIYLHYSKKDERKGLSLDDLKGSYHGVSSPSPLLRVLEQGHPAGGDKDLPDADRAALIAWLKGDRVSETYDDLDLGDAAPAEILSRNCLSCHGRKHASTQPAARALPLDFWDDVKKVAFSKRLDPVPLEILVVTTHTHALSLAVITVVVCGLVLCTSWPARLTRCVCLLAGLGLLVDIGSWWAARLHESLVFGIIAGGAVYNGLMFVALLLVLVDLFRPVRRGDGG
jgi:hypothetical protein